MAEKQASVDEILPLARYIKAIEAFVMAKNSTEMVIALLNLLVTILVALAAAVVTLLGFAFSQKSSLYLLLSIGVTFVGCVIYRLIRRWISLFLIDLADVDNPNIYNTYLALFLRKKISDSDKKVIRQIKENSLCDESSFKLFNRLVNPRKPVYIGTYPSLVWMLLVQVVFFLISFFLKGWRFV